ncbi:MAG: F0F1 ATP synthase subunit A [Geothrix sp.]|uniref:ATP synthase subunit a n=2 Tax=Geothrix TaxID=44675 RepID=A0A9D7XLT2_9BACT|nr:F0F1 ATP synthase subunit A [Candidatus Geothrix skivensis]
MEHHASLLAQWLTHVLGLAQHPWPGFAHGASLSVLERYDHLLNAALAALLTMLITTLVRKGLARIPGPLQQIFEGIVGGLKEMINDNIAHHGEKYLPFIGTMALFVFFNNLFGLLPGLSPGTSNWNVTLGAALVVFGYYNFHGMREQGFVKYWAHFAGPIWWLAPLMFPLEILGLLSRILSHSLRLFGNIAGEHVVAGIFFGLMPILLPVPMMFLGLFFGLIQTFVFTMLATIYLSGAVSHEH